MALSHSDGAFVVQEGGGYSYSAGMPTALCELLQQEKKKRRNKRSPSYVALGSNDRYYVRFTDGSSQWSGNELLSEKVRDGTSKGGIKSIAFGMTDSWFIVYGDGGWCNLSNCSGLDNKIGARQKRGDLKCVSLGPNGEWFMAAKNGRSWWGGYSDASQLPEQIKNVKDKITFMDFADGDTFIARYE